MGNSKRAALRSANAIGGKQPRRFGRRALLIGGGGVFAVAATSGWALFAPRPTLRGRRFLTATEAGVAVALAEALFDEPGAPGPEQTGLLARLDESVGGMHPETRKLFCTGLRALEYLTLPTFLGRFSQLSLPKRKAAVRRWERSPYLVAALLLSLRFTVAGAWFESDAGRAACGWKLGCVPTGAEG